MLVVELKAREGDFVETIEGLFFDVKGLLHPPDRIVAYLRYYPDNRGGRLLGDRRYAKVYDLLQRDRLLKSRWPHFLYFDTVQGRKLQGVPIGRIAHVHEPTQRLIRLVGSRRKGALEADAVKLVRALSHKSGLSYDHFGISGSLLVGLHRPNSDIDVIVYGAAAARRIQEALCTLLEESKFFRRHSTADFRTLYANRNLQYAVGFSDFVRLERRKVFEGRYMSHKYFIRCVRKWSEVGESYGDAYYRPMGQCRISARILDDSEGLLTPCRYTVTNVHVIIGKSSCKPSEIVSFRGRFAEQVRANERVIAHGRLETVRSGQSSHLRLVVGEGRRDILLPVE